MKKTTNILIFLIFAFLFLPNLAIAKPELQWEKTYGGANNDEGYCVQQTFDGGYIIVGDTYSNETESYDVYLIKTDSNGIPQWEKTLYTASDSFARSIRQTSDGGYIIAGYTIPFGSSNNADICIIKTDSSCNPQWERNFGASNMEYGESVEQTSDGGYIVTGCTYSYGTGGDVYLIKIDSFGNLLWEKNFGGRDFESGHSIQQTADGGFIITGCTSSYGSGIFDVYLIKTDSQGDSQWSQTFGGNDWDEGQSVRQTSDGGFIITGYTYSYGAGLGDVYLIKTDDSGEPQWERTLGANHTDKGLSVEQTSDGGYIITGNTQSYGYGGTDVYLIKTCSDGYLEWEKTFGGNNWDYGKSIEVTSDGGYIIAGYTYSFGAGKSDVYLIKLSDDYLTGKTIYVDDDGPADFNNIQAAIDDANDGDTILVAEGTYTGEGNRDVDFKGKAITVKSQNGPETCIIDCQRNYGEYYRGFYFHYNENQDSILQGFTITNGSAYMGGGICCENSSPKIIDCIITGNRASIGGGISTIDSSIRIINCTISKNIAADAGGINISKNDEEEVLIQGCIIAGNHAILHPRFGGRGGGIIAASFSNIINCTIVGNLSDGYWEYEGGGIWFGYGANVSNCIISDNINEEGNSYAKNQIVVGYYYSSDPRDQVIYPKVSIKDSLVGNNNENDVIVMTGNEDYLTGNWKSADPNFANPGYWDPNGTPEDLSDDYWVEGDYHLKSQAGRWDPNTQDWIQDDVNSPCIDAGDPNNAVGSEPRPNGGRINIGAYGGTSEASMSPTLPPSPEDMKASDPYPYDTAVGVEINPILSWSSGDNAVAHDVYFGTNYDNVNNATITNPLGVLAAQGQTSNSYRPGILNLNQSYNWRIDEVDEQGNRTKGDIWLFITVDGTKGRGVCFLPNTPVWVDGKFVPISTVSIGQTAGTSSTSIVEKLQEHVGMYDCRDVILENGNSISVVESHYFLLESGIWIASQNLQSGMKLKTMNGAITIESIRKREMPYVGKVYNVKVSGTHRYMVGEDAVIVRDY